MLHFKKFYRPLFDADSGNGGGGGDAAPADPTIAAATNDPNKDPGNNPPPVKNPPKDPAAETRYQISRQKDRADAAERRAQELENNYKNKPIFDAETDPDGTKEADYRAEQRAQEIVDKRMKDLGLEDTLKSIQYEKEEAKFMEAITTAAEEFKQYGIEVPTKAQLKITLDTLDKNGITPQQAIMLTQAQNIIERLKPGGFTPGTGGKPIVSKVETQAEINERIFKRDGAFGR